MDEGERKITGADIKTLLLTAKVSQIKAAGCEDWNQRVVAEDVDLLAEFSKIAKGRIKDMIAAGNHTEACAVLDVAKSIDRAGRDYLAISPYPEIYKDSWAEIYIV